MAAAKRSVAELATGAVVLLVAAGFLAYALINTGRSGDGGGTHLSAEFDNVGGVSPGSDVRIAGVKVGSVTGLRIDPRTYQAILEFTVRSDLKLSTDSSAVISTGGLLGNQFLTLAPGGASQNLADGGKITITQSATNLEDLLGKFIFNVGSLADATQKSLREKEGDAAMTPELWPGADGSPIACREKLRMLEENHEEALQVLQDAFEDAVLMGVDEGAMRRIMAELVAGLRSPKRA